MVEYGKSERRQALSPRDSLDCVPRPRNDGAPAESLGQQKDLADGQRIYVGKLIGGDQDLERDSKIGSNRC